MEIRPNQVTISNATHLPLENTLTEEVTDEDAVPSTSESDALHDDDDRFSTSTSDEVLYDEEMELDSDFDDNGFQSYDCCLLYTSPSPRDLSTSRMPSSA